MCHKHEPIIAKYENYNTVIALSVTSIAVSASWKSQEDDIREAVFRYQFHHNASALQQEAKVYCLAVGRKLGDPTDEFMRRFRNDKPAVRKASSCDLMTGNGVVERRTGNQGIELEIASLKWISDSEVEVEGGYYEGNMSSSGNLYTVNERDGKWRVTKDQMQSISRSSPGPLEETTR